MVKKKQQTEKKKSESDQRKRKRIWYVAIAVLALAIGCCFLFKTGLLDSQNVDKQLAAIEAARPIPDVENAAIIYYQLLENYDEKAFWSDSLSSEVKNLSIHQTWLSKDYPELAEWLKDQQDIISTLLQASKMEECRFSIVTDYQQINVDGRLLNAMRGWTRLLIRAVNNDIAEGRIDAGIQKYNCLIQMGKHLCQQPVLVYYMIGVASEVFALTNMNTFIVEGDVSEKHLKNIEAAVPLTKDNWAEVSTKIIEFEKLYERKNVSLFKRSSWWLQQQVGLMPDVFDITRVSYLRLLTNRRGTRILIALRCYRNKNGRWPQILDGIKDLVPADILVDPTNGGSFVYKLTEDNFTLYSKGKNNIDEGGKRSREFGAGDWPIWPPVSRKTKNEKADAQQSNTQKDVVK
jgi:hypothetical protein